ncbi:2'-deoxycytidine 5'-triphosphate deaminase [Alphaproteobacteria bacterium]|jgi:dCTP deaminase|nr:2'-deoxycytidine 5'-triphosphate deaminase [Alphaproteobacteria bacterium]MDC3270546.1 2'-deoxycytidine 5'-triphosphate deaminase [Alphaproteobacteria bacterium]
MNGTLVYEDYLYLYNNNKIKSLFFKKTQIQPSSIDLSLSEECYEIKTSFLSPDNKVRDKLKKIYSKKISLKNPKIFKKNKTYIVRLNETLNLSNSITGHCNPKSSTGRLNIFCRTILDYCDEYEKIPKNYNGEMFLEITTRSFDIKISKGDKLNQMRLRKKSNNYLSDGDLKKINKKTSLIFTGKKNIIENGLRISVDLSNDKKVCAYVAKTSSLNINFSKISFYEIEKFWKPLKPTNNSLIIEKNKFYILRSREKICIPSNLAGEMIPYDTGIGDFRAHYAGFFDPGFGDPEGSYAVLEVKTNELPFILENGQTIARIKYEKLNKKTSVVYGSSINSNYQNQKLALSKHFK